MLCNKSFLWVQPNACRLRPLCWVVCEAERCISLGLGSVAFVCSLFSFDNISLLNAKDDALLLLLNEEPPDLIFMQDPALLWKAWPMFSARGGAYQGAFVFYTPIQRTLGSPRTILSDWKECCFSDHWCN